MITGISENGNVHIQSFADLNREIVITQDGRKFEFIQGADIFPGGLEVITAPNVPGASKFDSVWVTIADGAGNKVEVPVIRGVTGGSVVVDTKNAAHFLAYKPTPNAPTQFLSKDQVLGIVTKALQAAPKKP